MAINNFLESVYILYKWNSFLILLVLKKKKIIKFSIIINVALVCNIIIDIELASNFDKYFSKI